MVILDEFVDLIEVVRIKMVALDANSLGNFVSVLQSRIIALTLRLKKVFDFTPRLVGVISKLMELQNFSQLACDSTLRSSLTCFCN